MYTAYLHGIIQGGVTLKLPDQPLCALDEASIRFIGHKLAHVLGYGCLHPDIAHDARVEVCLSLPCLPCSLQSKTLLVT